MQGLWRRNLALGEVLVTWLLQRIRLTFSHTLSEIKNEPVHTDNFRANFSNKGEKEKAWDLECVGMESVRTVRGGTVMFLGACLGEGQGTLPAV